MARKGGDDWDDKPKGKGGGTMSLDVSKLDLDDEPSGKGRRGAGGPARSGGKGRLDDDDEPGGAGKWGKGGRGGGKQSFGGFGKSSGTASFDVKDLDLNRGGGEKGRRGAWAAGDGKGKGSKSSKDLDDDDMPRGKGRDKMVGSRRDSAVKLDADDAEVESGFHDWGAPKPKPGEAAQPAAATPAPAEDGAPARLLVREPGKPDRVFPLHPKSRSWIVGREISCDLVLSDIKSSRQHFEITYLGGVFTLKDLGSGNGTKVDGEKVGKVQLVGGSIIVVGDCELVFQLDQQAMDRLLERELPGGKKRGRKADEEGEEGAADEQAEPERLLSRAAMGLILVMLLGLLLFAGTFVAWLVFQPSGKKPSGARVVELEEIPPSDPSIRKAVQATARAVLGDADGLQSLGKLWDARRLAKVAMLLDPSQAEARSLDGRVERTLKGNDSDACRVIVAPSNPVRGRKMLVRVALNGPVLRVNGTFAGEPLKFSPDPELEGTWLALLDTPRKPGSQKLELSVVDLLDEPVELAREVTVR